MSNMEDVLKMLSRAGIEFEESEDDSLSIITESGVEFVFKKNGSLKSVSPFSALIESVDKHDSWKYFNDEDEDDEWLIGKKLIEEL